MRYLKIAADLYKSQGNYKDALTMKEREHDLADSFFYKTTVQNIESLKAEYELTKSNAKVKELDLQNKKSNWSSATRLFYEMFSWRAPCCY